MKIGMCDSGVGGITVLKAVKDKYPNNEYIYLADLNNCPFGSKSTKELVNILYSILDELILMKVDLIIIACGTLSSVAITNNIYEYKGIKVLNIIDTIVETMKYKKFTVAAIMATKSTILQGTFEKKILESIPNIQVIGIGCVKFVDLIESNNIDSHNMAAAIDEYLTKEILEKINGQSIILGCTHYPLVSDKIKKQLLSNNISATIIVPGDTMVNYICNKNIIKNSKYSMEIYTTKESKVLTNFCNNMLDFKNNIKVI